MHSRARFTSARSRRCRVQRYNIYTIYIPSMTSCIHLAYLSPALHLQGSCMIVPTSNYDVNFTKSQTLLISWTLSSIGQVKSRKIEFPCQHNNTMIDASTLCSVKVHNNDPCFDRTCKLPSLTPDSADRGPAQPLSSWIATSDNDVSLQSSYSSSLLVCTPQHK